MDRLSPRARALLDRARDADDPTPAERLRADAAVRIGLAMHGVTDLPPLAAPSAPPQVEHAPAPEVGWGGAWKLGLGASALLVAGLVGVHVLRSASDAAPAAPAPSAPIVARAAVPATSAPAATSAEPDNADRLAAIAAVPARAGDATPSTAARNGAPHRAPTLARANTTLPAAAGSDLEREVRLIGSANTLIRQQRFQQALRVLAQHTERYPRGALREERDALHALALCGLGGSDERTQREVQRFLKSAPRSVVAQRVRATCAPPEGAPP